MSPASEVEAVVASGNPDDMVFQAPDVLARVEAHGDLFAPLRELEQTLPAPPG